MKLIHLSDLHLGKRVNEISMLENQEHILTQIIQIIDGEQPDAVLIAGDVYDKSVPSAEAVTLFDDFPVPPGQAAPACADHQRKPRLSGAPGIRRPAHGAGGRLSLPRIQRLCVAGHPVR